MTNGLAVVTGGGSGIGRALAARLARADLDVLVVGRREDALAATAAEAPGRVRYVTADVGSEDGRANVVQAVGSSAIRFLVHNAGTLEPIGALAEVALGDWRHNMAVNVEAPLFLTQALLPRLSGAARVLHISSGAAHHPYPGWGAYCTAKAALHMLYQVWGEELDEARIAVGSVRPGVVDTPMQALIRQQPESRFPRVERFLQLKEQGMLRGPEEVADFIAWLLLETDSARFAAQEWDIGDTQHTAAWRAART